jgi:hypothetical protein
MDLGRRIKRAKQAAARQNTAIGGAMSLREQAPASFEEDFGTDFARYLYKPKGNLHDEVEVDDDIPVSSDESEDGESVTTEGNERADPITEWTAQSSEAQPDIPPERFGRWVKTPPGRLSQGGTEGGRATGGLPPTRGFGYHPATRGKPTTGQTPLGIGGTTQTLLLSRQYYVFIT